MVQCPNIEKAGAYSSVSHLGSWVLGIFTFTQQRPFDGADLSVCQSRRIHRRAVHPGRVSVRAESFARDRFVRRSGDARTEAFYRLHVTMLASIGLPMLNNFIGEFLVLQGAALVNIKWSVFAAIGVIPVSVLHAVALSTRFSSDGLPMRSAITCPI